MQEDIDLALGVLEESIQHSIEHLGKELHKLRAGKATPDMVSGVLVDYYGSPTPLTQVANVTTSDSKTLVIQPWEKNMLAPIEKAIFEANMGFTPMNDGEVVRISVPPLTGERRQQLVKMAKSLGEDAKISIRNGRHKAMDSVKTSVKNGYPEDAGKRIETDIQNQVNSSNKKVDELIANKEKDIMTI